MQVCGTAPREVGRQVVNKERASGRGETGDPLSTQLNPAASNSTSGDDAYSLSGSEVMSGGLEIKERLRGVLCRRMARQ